MPVDIDAAFNAALNNADAVTQRFGVPFRNDNNNFDFRDIFAEELQRVQASLPPGANPATAFADVDLENILLGQQDSLRSSATSQFNNAINQFAPPGFAFSAIPGSADDSIIESLIQEQLGPAQNFITNATTRGLFTPQGAAGAQNTLQQQLSQARARASEAGSGVISEGRGELESQISNLIAQGRAGIGSLGLSDFVNAGGASEAVGRFVDPVRTGVDNLSGEFNENLEGRLRSAVPTDLFDTSNLLVQGGQAQSAQNNTGALFDALTNRRQSREQSRGLGTQGAF